MIDLQKLILELTEDDIIEIMQDLGADRYKVRPEAIIFPTICHNEDAAEASLKLYYYKDTKLFHCYTDCSSSFNLFTLVEKVWELQGKRSVKLNKDKKSENDFCFYDVVRYVAQKGNQSLTSTKVNGRYKSDKERLIKKDRLITLPAYPTNLLDMFDKIRPIEWLEEGISEAALDKFDISYSITIPNEQLLTHR